MDPKYHPKIIGRKGAIITNIRTEHDVNIQFPEKNDENQVQGLFPRGFSNATTFSVSSVEIKINHCFHYELKEEKRLKVANWCF